MGEREFSCIKQVVKTVQIPLPATYISNEIPGIAEILESWKRQYKKQLQGVVVNYRNYSLLSPSGFIAPNKPFVYYNVKATFDLFCPKVGDIVKGKINRISNEHIGCLIEETINVTIHLSKHSNEELSPFINLNRKILFQVSFFSYDRKMIRVTGKITPKCIQLMKDLFPPITFNDLVDTPELSNNTDEGIGTSSESTDDGLLNHTFNYSEIKNDGNFKKPLSSIKKSKKKSSKRPKSDSESSFMDTSDILNSDEKPKKKKKHKDKTFPDMGIHLSANSLSLDSVSCNTLIQNFSNFKHAEVLGALKEEEELFEDTSVVKKHKKKRKEDSSSFVEESSQSNNQSFHEDASSFVLDSSVVNETVKLSKKRKRESESSFIDTLELSTADEMPKKKKKCKDKKTVPPLEKEIKNELLDMPVDHTVNAGVLCVKRELSLSPVKVVNNTNPVSKKKKKSKDKKSKDKNKDKKSKDKSKSKKKKGKVLASGAILKKDKNLHKKGSKKNKLDGEQSKKHKKDKSDKKNKSEKKKKKDNSNTKKVSDVINSEIN